MQAKILLLEVLLSSALITASAQNIISLDFQTASSPGYFGSEWLEGWGGGSVTGPLWTISSSVIDDGTGRYAQYLETTPSPPPLPETRWATGLSASKFNFVALRSQWSVSFAVRRDLVEPLRIQVELVRASSPSDLYTALITPEQSGWSHVTVNWDAFSMGTSSKTN